MKINDICSLTFISSESCNLNCEYCKIAKMTSSLHAEEAKKVKQAFIDGSYTNKMVEILHKYNQSPENIFEFSFWGQEPTLTLDAVTIDFPHMISCFPNLNKIFFSTNGIQYADRLINFIKKIDETVTHGFELEIQFSYDGQYSNENIRKINTNELIENNLIKFFTELNNLSLKHVQFKCCFHGVISMKLLKELYTKTNSQESINIYWNNIDNFITKCKNLVKNNSNITIEEKFCPGLINCYNATSFEGQLLQQFCLDSLKLQHFEIFCIYNQICGNLLEKYTSLKDIDEFLNKLILSNQSILDKSDSNACNVIEGNLNVRYTGEILHCQNLAFTLDKNELLANNLNDLDVQIKLNLLDHSSSFPNLLTSSKESVDKFLWKWSSSEAKNFISYQLILTINLMLLLANCNQISCDYLINQKKLIRHAFYIVNTFSCWENNLNETASVFGRAIGQIRLLANGMCDEIDNFLIDNFNEKKEENK